VTSRRSKERKHNRLPEIDYSQPGSYFVTICTKGSIQHFGVIKDGNVKLGNIGKIVRRRWLDIPDHYDNVKIDEFVIMPNHIHGIVIIEESHSDRRDANVGTEQCSVPTDRGIEFGVGRRRNYGLLSKLVKSFKDSVTKEVRKHYGAVEFVWQRSFYDHVIRNENSLHEIRKYILQNPAKWSIDEYNASCIHTAK
jgi:putative transposase